MRKFTQILVSFPGFSGFLFLAGGVIITYRLSEEDE
jgi:hypothetical protein